MSENPPTDRAKLAELLEAFGGSMLSFDQLRPDSYEVALAAYSLEQLASLYAEIFKVGQSSREASQQVPPWPPGSKLEGQQPGRVALDRIFHRFARDKMARDMAPINNRIDNIEKRARKMPVGNQGRVIDAMITMLSEEVIAQKLNGKGVIQNLDALDRLQNQQLIALKDKALAQSQSKIDLAFQQYRDKVAEQKARIESTLLTARKGGISEETLREIEEAAKLL
jgi:hypothetical protein